MRLVVQPGDTLFSIALQFRLSPRTLIAVNPQITDPARIVPGELIEVPLPGEREAGEFDRPYIVRSGETLTVIAQTFGVTVQDLLSNNPVITNPNEIFPGQVLFVPGGPARPLIEGCLAFISSRGGGFDLFLLGQGLMEPRQLTFGEAGPFSQPRWSPDGRRVAMVAAGNRLIVVDSITQSVVTVAEGGPLFPVAFDWSPDGRRLVFDQNNNVFIAEVPDGAPRMVISNADTPWFFPDGERLLISSTRDEFEQLFIIGLDGSIIRQVTQNTNGPLGQVTLSPTGERVVFSQPGAAISVFTIVDVATGQIFEVEAGPLAQDHTPRWSPDGELLAFYSRDLQEQFFFNRLRLVDRNGRSVREAARSSCDQTGSLAWSPDGRRLAFIDCPLGKPDLFTIGVTGMDLRRLTTLGANQNPNWAEGSCPLFEPE